jgi:hypothetical protein
MTEAERSTFNMRMGNWYGYEGAEIREQYMFALEPLTAVHPALKVQEVRVTGVPGWFANCLKMRIQGEGGGVERTEWSSKTFRRRAGVRHGKKKIRVTTRAWQYAVWDWRAFAERNGIQVPVSARSFFEVS